MMFLKRWKGHYAVHRNREDGLMNFGLSDVYFQKNVFGLMGCPSMLDYS